MVTSLDLHANITPADDGARGRADRLSHLSACGHGGDRPRLRRAHGADPEERAALRKGVPAAAVPHPDQLAMHVRPAVKKASTKSLRALQGEQRADAVVRAGLSRRPISSTVGRAFSPMAATQADADAAADELAAVVIGHEKRFRRPHLYAGRRRAHCDGAGEEREEADRHRRHPGQSGRRRRFRHHRHAARTGAQQRDARRDRRRVRSAVRRGRACGRRRRDGAARARRQIRHRRRRAL